MSTGRTLARFAKHQQSMMICRVVGGHDHLELCQRSPSRTGFSAMRGSRTTGSSAEQSGRRSTASVAAFDDMPLFSARKIRQFLIPKEPTGRSRSPGRTWTSKGHVARSECPARVSHAETKRVDRARRNDDTPIRSRDGTGPPPESRDRFHASEAPAPAGRESQHPGRQPLGEHPLLDEPPHGAPPLDPRRQRSVPPAHAFR